MTAAEDIAREIERLHAFLAGWLSGTLAPENEIFAEGIERRLHADFTNIQPGGWTLTRDDLLSQLRAGWGASPDFAIRVRAITVLDTSAPIATYEEYQRGARNSARAENARKSTAIFHMGPDGLLWRHIHETWLPEAAHAPENFRF